MIRPVSLLLLAALALPAAAPTPKPAPIATFSVVAYSPATGEVGVAVQSKFFAVGTVVPWAEAGVGAVATQAFGHPGYGSMGLELMALGLTPEEALEVMLRPDGLASRRQLGIVDATGLAATHTGDDTLDWAGGLTGTAADGVVWAVQGNILAGAGVVEAMAAAMERTDHADFAGRLLAALVAGQAEGGDSRGMQSAALLVKQEGAGYGGYTDTKYDLRVDDAEDPFAELGRLLAIARPVAVTFEAYTLLYEGEHERAAGMFLRLMEMEPDDAGHPYNAACAFSLWGGHETRALDLLALALEMDPGMVGHARGDSDLDPLRGLGRFAELVPPA
ncbi:DUF1028 domain-containing protein [bacterium]|nr:DUF1028 domain-containing protein [bacterium]